MDHFTAHSVTPNQDWAFLKKEYVSNCVETQSALQLQIVMMETKTTGTGAVLFAPQSLASFVREALSRVLISATLWHHSQSSPFQSLKTILS